MIICFTGIDGSGKTTQAKLLQKVLNKQGRAVVYVHFFQRNILSKKSWLDRVINLLTKSLDEPVRNRVKAVGKLTLRLTFLLASSWLTYLVDKVKHKHEVVIYDRYCYDSLIIIASRSTTLANLIMVLSKLMPKPDIVMLLEITPETSVKRKPEYTVDDARRICNLYARLKQLLPVNVVNAESSIEQVREYVTKLCNSLL
jgi:dTMP kinase